MQYNLQKDALPAMSPAADAPVVPAKSVVLIRWAVVLISCSLILFRARTLPPFLSVLLDIVAALYALSNIGLYFVAEAKFRELRFNVQLVAVDTLVLTGSLIINGQAETNFYLTYFLLIIICSIFENRRMIAMVSLAAPLAYAGFFFDAAGYHPADYLQLIFLLVAGLFYGHFFHLVRTQRILAERSEQRSQAKTELLNILSHELKTPLTVIASYAQALKSAALGEINHDQEQALTKILRQTEHLESIVNVILESAGLETGAVAVHLEELGLSEFLDELKQNYEGTTLNARVALVWDYTSLMGMVKSDPGKLKMILLNLIDNALKFTDEGEVRVSAQQQPERQKMVLSVTDTGIGIAADQLPFVFDKFWQVESARTRTQSGIGMGLYIVKAFTELLGGKVTVSSTIERGTRFTLELPTA